MKNQEMFEILSKMNANTALANQALTTNLVAYLAKTGVIDTDDYLAFTKQIQQKLIDRAKNSDGTEDEVLAQVSMIELIFEVHQMHFEK